MKPKPHSSSHLPLDEQRRMAMDVILSHVPFDGWTKGSYEQGVRERGLTPGAAALLFPRGMYDVIDLFGTMADEAMLKRIKNERIFAKLRVRDKIAFSVRTRLEFLTPYRESVRRLMTWYAMPLNWPAGAKRIYRTVDLIWRSAGDASTDFNFYTKRGLLAGVVKATILFWLEDETPGCHASWEFLDRRIADVMRIGQAIGKLKKSGTAHT